MAPLPPVLDTRWSGLSLDPLQILPSPAAELQAQEQTEHQGRTRSGVLGLRSQSQAQGGQPRFVGWCLGPTVVSLAKATGSKHCFEKCDLESPFSRAFQRRDQKSIWWMKDMVILSTPDHPSGEVCCHCHLPVCPTSADIRAPAGPRQSSTPAEVSLWIPEHPGASQKEGGGTGGV